MKTLRCLFAMGLLLAGVMLSGQVNILINFDAVDASAAPGGISGATLDSYLAGYGVSLSNVGGGTTVGLFDERQLYGGGAVNAPSNYNVLLQSGTSSATSYQLNFSSAASNVTFYRAGLIAGPSGVSHPAWNVSAYGSANTFLGSVSDTTQSYFSNQAAIQYSLPYSNISYLIVSGNAGGFAAFTTIVMDDLAFTSAIPEPSTYALCAGLAGMGLALLRRRQLSQAGG